MFGRRVDASVSEKHAVYIFSVEGGCKQYAAANVGIYRRVKTVPEPRGASSSSSPLFEP
jgi:hypothetical protein